MTKYQGKSRDQLLKEVGDLRKRVEELTRAEKRLIRAEEALRLTQFSVDHAADGAFLVSSDARFLYVNEAACRLLGYTRAELLSMTIHDIDPNFPKKMWSQAWAQRSRPGIRTIESKHRTKDGRVIPVEITSKYLEFKGNEYVCAFARDITKRKRTERRLRETNARLRAIFDSEPECVKLLDSDGVLLEINRAGIAMLEADDPKQVLDRCIYPLIVPECRESFKAMVNDVFEGKMRHLEFEMAGLKGTRRWLETHAGPLQGESEAIVSLLAVTRDVTENKRSEQALRDSEERYRELFENANDIIVTIDLAGNFTSLNKAAETLSGYSREEALRINIAQVLAPDHLKKARETMERVLSEKPAPTQFESELLARDGRRVPIEISFRLILRDGQPAGFQVLARDVTEQRSLEEQVRQSQKLEAIGRLAGGVAHDFNNLLTAILGYADLLTMEVPENSPMQADLAAVKSAAERAAALTRQLLAFSRRQALQHRILDLNTIIGNLEKLLSRLVGEDVELILRPAPDLGKVLTDPGQMEQVLMNLTVNARDAMPGGGKLVIETANIELRSDSDQPSELLEPGSYVMVAVADTGIGMDEITRSRIYEPFFTTKDTGKGTGLGLSTVYGIVKQSGGGIRVESAPGRGSIFRIYLPRVEEAAEPDEDSTASRILEQGRGTILVVEDEELVRSLIRNVLSSSGYRVLEASHGEEAMKVLESRDEPVDLVLTDIVMPRMGGRLLAERLTALQPKTKLIYMSGYTDWEVSRQEGTNSEIPFILKPFTPGELTAKLREVLGSANP